MREPEMPTGEPGAPVGVGDAGLDAERTSACSNCGRTPATERTLVVDEERSLAVTFCETCRTDVLAVEWIDEADEHG